MRRDERLGQVLCDTHTHTHMGTRYSYVKCIFGRLRWPLRCAPTRRASQRQLFHLASSAFFRFVLPCFGLPCVALAGILNAEIYDILVGIVHLSYRSVGIALSRRREQRRAQSRLSSVALVMHFFGVTSPYCQPCWLTKICFIASQRIGGHIDGPSTVW